MPAPTTIQPCPHDVEDPMWCSICRKSMGWMSGRDRQFNDCTVQTVVNVTGATYDEAVELLRDAGRRDGNGATASVTCDAIEAAGWKCTATSLTIDQAMRSGRTFFVSARRRNVGHAFAIVAGSAINAGSYTHGVRYRIWEVA